MTTTKILATGHVAQPVAQTIIMCYYRTIFFEEASDGKVRGQVGRHIHD